MFYAYLYVDPITFEPFYVGKGQGDRALSHFEYGVIGNPHFERRLKKMLKEQKVPFIQKISCSTEKEAFNLERGLIKLIGRADLKRGPLLNLTDGGEGPAGRKSSEKVKKRMRENNPANYHPEKKSSVIKAIDISTGVSFIVRNRKKFAEEHDIPYTSIGWALQHNKLYDKRWKFEYVERRVMGV